MFRDSVASVIAARAPGRRLRRRVVKLTGRFELQVEEIAQPISGRLRWPSRSKPATRRCTSPQEVRMRPEIEHLLDEGVRRWTDSATRCSARTLRSLEEVVGGLLQYYMARCRRGARVAQVAGKAYRRAGKFRLGAGGRRGMRGRLEDGVARRRSRAAGHPRRRQRTGGTGHGRKSAGNWQQTSASRRSPGIRRTGLGRQARWHRGDCGGLGHCTVRRFLFPRLHDELKIACRGARHAFAAILPGDSRAHAEN